MAEPLAYHLVVRAMEGAGGMDAQRRFALAIRHAIDGHLPHWRYRESAKARKRDGASVSVVEGAVADWMSTDLNPATRVFAALSKPSNAVWAYNAYNLHGGLGARTSVDPWASAGALASSARREFKIQAEDPELCRVGTLSVLERVLRQVARNGSRGGQRAPGLLDVGRLLGVEASASFQVAEALALGAAPSLAGLAQALGSSKRSLQRRLAEESTSVEALRMSSRLVMATDALRTDMPMEEIAWRCGFSDLPHMSRALRASSGMTPGLLRQAMRGGAEPEPARALADASGMPLEDWRERSTPG